MSLPEAFNLDHFFMAMHKGAALVYHDILAVEANITNWRHDNPVLSAMIDQGVEYGVRFLKAHGIPFDNLDLAKNAVLATLRDMAADDASVNSISPKATPSVAS